MGLEPMNEPTLPNQLGWGLSHPILFLFGSSEEDGDLFCDLLINHMVVLGKGP